MNRRTFFATSILAAGAVLSRADDLRHKERPHLKKPEIADIEKDLEKKCVGLKMLCIDDSFSEEQTANCDVLPVCGKVYTIRAIRIGFRATEDQYHPSVLFDEIVNTRLIYGKEPAFWATRFECYDSDEE